MRRLVSRAVRLAVSAPSLLFCAAVQNSAAPRPWRSDQLMCYHFPQLKPLLQLQVPVDTFWDFGKEQATTVAAQHGPRLVTSSWLLRDFLPKPWRTERPRTRGSAIAEARQSSVSRCLSRSDTATSRMGQFGSGLSSRGSPGSTGCEL